MADWPLELRGITESVVTTSQPDGAWNLAALGLRARGPVIARTWGNTRTRRNFEREGGGFVQFTRNPVSFVEAALSIRELSEPILEDADAWVRVEVARLDAGESNGTSWVDWELIPTESKAQHRVIPTVNRGHNAVVEATVAASRLDVSAFDEEILQERLDFFEDVARRCGGEREHVAFDRLNELIGR